MQRDVLGSSVEEIISYICHALLFIKSACTSIFFKHFKPQKITAFFFCHIGNFIEYKLTVAFTCCTFGKVQFIQERSLT